MDASAYADESQSLEAEQHMALIWTEQNVNVFEFMWVNLCVVYVARLFFSLVFINWATAAAVIFQLIIKCVYLLLCF